MAEPESGRAAPTRQATEEKLRGLATGSISPEHVAEWARSIDHDAVDDPVIFEAIEQLEGADSLDFSTEQEMLLHVPEDFRGWLSDFLSAIGEDGAVLPTDPGMLPTHMSFPLEQPGM
jgi:hypothetical protein